VDEDVPKADDWDTESYDKHISAQVLFPVSGTDQEILGTVIGQKRDIHGNSIGVAHSNPILNTRIYKVQLPDGHIEEFSANIIAECIYSQLDNEGRHYVLLDAIIDHDQFMRNSQRKSYYKYLKVETFTPDAQLKDGSNVYHGRMDPLSGRI
jgi:hypothetical protein